MAWHAPRSAHTDGSRPHDPGLRRAV